MRSLDFKAPYKAVKARPSPAFPDRKVTHLPLLKIDLLHGDRVAHTIGLIDSGAVGILAPTDLADVLGIDWRSAPTTPVSGIGGAGEGHVFDVQLLIVPADHG